jgi:hypothetical protein
MSGLFNLPKTWVDDEVLTNEDLNDQFSSVKDNMIAEKVEGASTINNVYNPTKAIAQTNPHPVGPTNYASSVEDEIKRLRYMISSITGESNYTIAPATNIKSIVNSISKGILSNTINTFNSIEESVENGAYSLTPTLEKSCIVPVSSDSKFGSSSLIVGGPGVENICQQFYQVNGRKFSIGFWFKNPLADKPLVTIPGVMGQISVTIEGKIKFSFASTTASSSTKKEIISITGTSVVLGSQWVHVLVSVDGSLPPGSRKVNLYVNGVQEGTQITNGTFNIPDNFQGSMHFGSNVLGYVNGEYDPSSVANSSVAMMNTATPTGFTVSGSLLNFLSQYNTFSAASTTLTSNSPQVAMGSPSVWTIVKAVIRVDAINDNTSVSAANTGFRIRCKDASVQRTVFLCFTRGGVAIDDFNDARVLFVPIDTSIIREYTLAINNYTAHLFIDGEKAASLPLISGDSAPGNDVSIGFSPSSSGSVAVYSFENYVSTSGYLSHNVSSCLIDDFLFLNDYIQPGSMPISQLQLASSSSLFYTTGKHYEPVLCSNALFDAAPLPTSPSDFLTLSYAIDPNSDYLFTFQITARHASSGFTINCLVRESTFSLAGANFLARKSSNMNYSVTTSPGSNAPVTITNSLLIRGKNLLLTGGRVQIAVSLWASTGSVFMIDGSNYYSITPIRRS